jgi:hypothetical protein
MLIHTREVRRWRSPRSDLFGALGAKIRNQRPDRNRASGSDVGGAAGVRAVSARAAPDPVRRLPVVTGRAATGPARRGTAHRGTYPSLADI